MCGLVGAVGDLSFEFRSRVFKDFLDVCSTRGRDSTGVIKVGRDLEYDWVKQIGSPAYLYDSKQYERHIETGPLPYALIGHTRSKTVGEVSIKNAHPFDFPDEGICGVHNGTLRNYTKLDTHAYNKVDSEVLYGHLAANGPQDTFSILEGAYACIWWNDKDKTINFIRNNERPLWFTWSEDCKTMFWASEIWMFAAVERKLKLWDGGEEKKKFIELPPHKLWSFRINPEAKGDERLLTMRPIVQIDPVPEKKAYTGPYSGGSNWMGRERTSTTIGGRDSDWSANGDGTFSRIRPRVEPEVQKKDEEGRSTQGGSVANPFLVDREQIERQLLLEDKGRTRGGKTTTDISSVEFLRASVQGGDSSTPSRNGSKSKNNILSLPSRNSSSSPSSSNVERLNSSTAFCPGVNLTSLRKITGVSHRVINGVSYITDNKTKNEWSEKDFLEASHGICCTCKEPIGDISQVGEIINIDNFICDVCLLPPVKAVFGRKKV